jgi:hypothetical protein
MSSLINTFIVTIPSQSHNGLTFNREIWSRGEVPWVEILFDLPELFQAARVLGCGWVFESRVWEMCQFSRVFDALWGSHR